MLAPVVKANGYGIGAKEMASHLSKVGATLFVVLDAQEAREIAPHTALVLHPVKEEIDELLSLWARAKKSASS